MLRQSIAEAGYFFDSRLGEVFFEPNVGDDKEIPTPHFPEVQLGHSSTAVAPGDGDDGPGKASDNGLERYFNGEVEVGGKERLAAIKHCFSIRFESIGRIVQSDTECPFDKKMAKRLIRSLNQG